ncbi:hypothetical protein ACFV1C_11835 [Streptomyces sp. NPDC059605]|uniref:hypothetical protein n=1 Tax=unclassified Streptomyces TaxID=2593676 RepID=UPI003673EBA4
MHTPDLYEGHTFDTLDEGGERMTKVGSGELLERGVRSVDGSPAEQVYIGFSPGVLPAQKPAQTRPGARGAVFLDRTPTFLHDLDTAPDTTDPHGA